MSNTELSELSEFFSAVSKEKNENLEKLKTKIESPNSDLADLFKQLETAHKETSKISEEPPKEKNENLEKLETKITPPNMSLADLFKQLETAHKETIQITEESLEISEEILSPIEIQPEIIEIQPEIIELQPEIIDSVEKTEELEEAPKPDNIIQEIVSALDDMGEKAETKEITELEVLRKEFSKFKDLVIQKMSEIGGGGSTKISEMDDVDTSSQQNDYALQYNSTTGKYDFGEVASDLSAVAQDIIPDANNTRSLGSASKRWSTLYLHGQTMDLGGAIIDSDGTGQLTIAATGATLPVGSKAGNYPLAVTGSGTGTVGAPIRLVPFFTQTSGLSTAATNFEFNATIDNRRTFTDNATFKLSDGSNLSEAGISLFQL